MTCTWNKNFTKNAGQFKIRFPQLYELLQSRFESVISLLENEEKNCTEENSLEPLNKIFSFWNFSFARDESLTVKENDILLHSGYSPVKEVQKLFNCDEIKDSDCTWIFAGIGLGYAPLEFARTRTDSLMVIIEPDPGFLFASMCALDWSDIFNHEKCVIVTDANPEQIVPLLENLHALDKTKIVSQNSQTKHQEQWFKTFFTLFERNKQKQNINTNTLERFSSLWLRNSAKNLKTFSECSGIEIYKNMLDKKIPALICAAGPTLETVLPHLKEIKKRAVIIAVDTALRSLLRYDVEPDFVILIDPQYYAANHIAGLKSPSSVLITESSVYPSVMRFECRKKVLCESLFPLGQYFEKKLLPSQSFGKITAGGSVSTSAWDFAKYIGADKIYMAGLDLGYPQNKTHIKGSTFEEKSHSTSTKLNSAENNLCSILFSAANEKSVDYEDNQIITDSKMKLFAWWFESQIAKYPQIETFTLSEKSLKIPGIKIASCSSLLALNDISLEKQSIIETSEKQHSGFDSDSFSKALQDLKDTMSDLYEQAKKGFYICDRILSESPAKAEAAARSKFAELEKIDSFIMNSQAKNAASLVFPTQRQLEELLSNEKPFSSQILCSIQKSRIIYSELKKAVSQYQKYL